MENHKAVGGLATVSTPVDRMVKNPAGPIAGQEIVVRAHADAQALANPDGSARQRLAILRVAYP